MYVIFFRHGERLLGQGPDPGLSAAGIKQAEALSSAVEKGRLPKPDSLWVSPKKRTLETFAPLATNLGIEIEIIGDLDERMVKENPQLFRQRVIGVLQRLEKLKKNIFICTHLDWLEEVVTAIADEGNLHLTSIHWSTASYVSFQVSEGHWMSQQQGQVQ